MGLHVHHLIHEYGCWIVFAFAALQAVGAPIPGTTALVVAAAYAGNHGGLPIAGVIASAAGGALLGTCVGYALGRWGGEPMLHGLGRRLRQPPERIKRWRGAFASNTGKFLFFGRFITGVRNVLGLVSGASGVPLARFVPICAAAAAAWAVINGLEYYWFGNAIANADTWVQVVLVLGGLVWLVFTLRFLRRKMIAITAPGDRPLGDLPM
jgi:membrane protein DedA with SNARE-associated domain